MTKKYTTIIPVMQRKIADVVVSTPVAEKIMLGAMIGALKEGADAIDSGQPELSASPQPSFSASWQEGSNSDDHHLHPARRSSGVLHAPQPVPSGAGHQPVLRRHMGQHVRWPVGHRTGGGGVTAAYWGIFIGLTVCWIVACAVTLIGWNDARQYWKPEAAKRALIALACGIAIPIWPIGVPVLAFLGGRKLTKRLIADIRQEQADA